jgi:hypothetical protein
MLNDVSLGCAVHIVLRENLGECGERGANQEERQGCEAELHKLP